MLLLFNNSNNNPLKPALYFSPEAVQLIIPGQIVNMVIYTVRVPFTLAPPGSWRTVPGIDLDVSGLKDRLEEGGWGNPNFQLHLGRRFVLGSRGGG